MDDRKSTSGFCVILGPNLFTWGSKKQSVVARSSTESEYRAFASAASELVWIQLLLHEIGIDLQSSSPILWCDNMSAQALSSILFFMPELSTSNWMFILFVTLSPVKN